MTAESINNFLFFLGGFVAGAATLSAFIGIAVDIGRQRKAKSPEDKPWLR